MVAPSGGNGQGSKTPGVLRTQTAVALPQIRLRWMQIMGAARRMVNVHNTATIVRLKSNKQFAQQLQTRQKPFKPVLRIASRRSQAWQNMDLVLPNGSSIEESRPDMLSTGLGASFISSNQPAMGQIIPPFDPSGSYGQRKPEVKPQSSETSTRRWKKPAPGSRLYSKVEEFHPGGKSPAGEEIEPTGLPTPEPERGRIEKTASRSPQVPLTQPEIPERSEPRKTITQPPQTRREDTIAPPVRPQDPLTRRVRSRIEEMPLQRPPTSEPEGETPDKDFFQAPEQPQKPPAPSQKKGEVEPLRKITSDQGRIQNQPKQPPLPPITQAPPDIIQRIALPGTFELDVEAHEEKILPKDSESLPVKTVSKKQPQESPRVQSPIGPQIRPESHLESKAKESQPFSQPVRIPEPIKEPTQPLPLPPRPERVLLRGRVNPLFLRQQPQHTRPAGDLLKIASHRQMVLPTRESDRVEKPSGVVKRIISAQPSPQDRHPTQPVKMEPIAPVLPKFEENEPVLPVPVVERPTSVPKTQAAPLLHPVSPESEKPSKVDIRKLAPARPQSQHVAAPRSVARQISPIRRSMILRKIWAPEIMTFPITAPSQQPEQLTGGEYLITPKSMQWIGSGVMEISPSNAQMGLPLPKSNKLQASTEEISPLVEYAQSTAGKPSSSGEVEQQSRKPGKISRKSARSERKSSSVAGAVPSDATWEKMEMPPRLNHAAEPSKPSSQAASELPKTPPVQASRDVKPLQITKAASSLPLIQRVEEGASESPITADSPTASESGGKSPAPDPRELAKMVYPLIKRMLALERERYYGSG